MDRLITVCIATFDRPQGVRRAIDSALAQVGPPVAVVVINQGDPATTEALAQEYAGREVTVRSSALLGLAMSRNAALELVATPWVGFLDDDDHLDPSWSEIFGSHTAPDVGLISCSSQLRSSQGEDLGVLSSDGPVDLIEDVTGNHLAGCFIARTDAVRAIGGYLPGLPGSHQTELWVRLVSEVRAMGLRIVADRRIGTVLVRAPRTERPLSDPALLFEGGRWLLARHRRHLRLPRSRRANAYGAVSVHAARYGRWPEARRYAATAALAQPLDLRRWARLALCLAPPAAARVWPGAHVDGGLANQFELVRDLAADLPEWREDLHFLPWGYRVNPPSSSDARGAPFWERGDDENDVRYQDGVYRWAAKLIRSGKATGSVVDIGCGSGHKLIRHLAPVATCTGVDQASGIDVASATFPDGRWIAADLEQPDAWAPLHDLGAGLVICADVLEHVPAPYVLLDQIRSLIGSDGRALLSTPDRDRLDHGDPAGPPRNPRHVREWNRDEFELLLAAAGLRIVARRRLLPRRYSATVLEAKRTLWRLLHGKAIPDRRSCMAFLVERTEH